MSLRALMLLVAVVAGWLGCETNRARKQARAIAIIEKAGGYLAYDDYIDDEGEFHRENIRPHWKEFLMPWLGDDYAREARSLWFYRDLESTGERLSDEVSDAIADLTELRSLSLYYLDFGDAHLARFRGHQKLRSLHLGRGRGITDAGLVHLVGLSHLMAISLYGTRIGNAGLAHLVRVPELRWLRLDETRVTDAGMEHLARCAKLECLTLSNTQVSDAGLAHFVRSNHIKLLDLSHTRVGDNGLARLATIPGLRWLALERTHVTDAGLEHLTGCAKLEQLDLTSTQVSDAGIRHLRKLPSLRVLKIDNTSVTPAGIEELKRANPEIEIVVGAGLSHNFGDYR